jgi:formylglycine-generating enzyme required for sulfatase activity
MVYIAPGSFTMGFDDGGHNRQVTVTLTKGYCIDQTEVTVAAYSACVSAKACSVPTGKYGCMSASTNTYMYSSMYSPVPNTPVNCITWDQANTYCTLVEPTFAD